ncbi:MAG: hypothetical protein KAH20_09980 [Methylococcales bacterium]|nr:hypothetical protein [Methylococcales bacterium]
MPVFSSISNNSHNVSSHGLFSHQNRLVDNKQDNLDQDTSIQPTHLEIEKPESDDFQKQQEVQKLKARDQEVRTHEQAHLSAAGGLATSGASFSYQKGADGVNYAVGGEVNIDTAAIAGDAAATIRKAETIKRAALAPASPSSQDVKVAQQASAMANKARAELFQKNQEITGDEVKANKISLSA